MTENLFEARFRFVQELARLGADVRTDGHHALVRGRGMLSAAPVEATDIRAGAGLVLAGLVAEGQTTVYGVGHIDRGYAGFVPALQGARRRCRARGDQRPLASSSRARASSDGHTMTRGPSVVVARLARTPPSSSRRRITSPSM